MSRQLGYFDDDVRDFPELNKCPDCETFFASLECPICGKTCPEEMRAGNRKPVKVRKKRRPSGNGRVQFVPWYLSTWFIVLMLFVQPIIGLVLLWMSNWRRVAKIIVTVILVLYTVGYALLGSLLGVIFGWFGQGEEPPVNTTLSREEYMLACQELGVETVYREAERREGEFVTLTLDIKGIWTDADNYEGYYPLYYECTAESGGKTWTFLVRDYRADDVALTVGDRITVYGQIGGRMEIYNQTRGELVAPGIWMSYATIEK